MATASDGTVIANPKALRSNLTCLKRLQRRLSRKQKGSKNREKARKRLARQHARVAHIRRDALHKATSKLTRARLIPEERAARQASIAASLPEPKTKVKTSKGKHQAPTEAPPLPTPVAMKVKKQQAKRLLRQATEADVPLRPRMLVLETLNVTGMLKNHHLAQAIADVGLTEFKRQVEYKTSWMGETLQLADRWYPSTRRCSSCGHERDIDLSERVYICLNDECRLVIDRDLNAALNLAALAL
jgi:putative transposase